jgi:hypothetical protein
MEFPFEPSGQAVGRLLGCSPDDATSMWKSLRERQLIELRSRFDARRHKTCHVTGDSRAWRSLIVEEECAVRNGWKGRTWAGAEGPL